MCSLGAKEVAAVENIIVFWKFQLGGENGGQQGPRSNFEIVGGGGGGAWLNMAKMADMLWNKIS